MEAGPRLLRDRYGRPATDLRVSVTRRCNFSCVYCHDEGLGPTTRVRDPHEDEMTPEEIGQRVRIAREFAIRSVKLTGGEPLVRTDIDRIVALTVQEVPDVSMTTNGTLLARKVDALRGAGLKRLNVSIDTLDPDAFRQIRGGRLGPVLRGVRRALEAGLVPVKLNVVLFPRTLEHLPSLIDFVGGTDGLRLQLIQFMPEQARGDVRPVDLIALKEDLASRADTILVRPMHHRRIYRIGGAEIEIVDPVGNEEFCMNCQRVRVTHDGKLKGCLNRDDDLVPTRGLDDEALREAFRRVVAARVPYYGVHVRTSPPPRVTAAGPA